MPLSLKGLPIQLWLPLDLVDDALAHCHRTKMSPRRFFVSAVRAMLEQDGVVPSLADTSVPLTAGEVREYIQLTRDRPNLRDWVVASADGFRRAATPSDVIGQINTTLGTSAVGVEVDTVSVEQFLQCVRFDTTGKFVAAVREKVRCALRDMRIDSLINEGSYHGEVYHDGGRSDVYIWRKERWGKKRQRKVPTCYQHLVVSAWKAKTTVARNGHYACHVRSLLHGGALCPRSMDGVDATDLPGVLVGRCHGSSRESPHLLVTNTGVRRLLESGAGAA